MCCVLLCSLLEEKRKEFGDKVSKLRNGLEKIDDTRTKVQAMSVELEETRVKVAEFQKQCEEYLVVIVQQKQVKHTHTHLIIAMSFHHTPHPLLPLLRSLLQDADEQAKAVSARSEKIAVEEARCKDMADAAQHDLDEALPALEEAVKVCCQCSYTQVVCYSLLPLSAVNSIHCCDSHLLKMQCCIHSIHVTPHPSLPLAVCQPRLLKH